MTNSKSYSDTHGLSCWVQQESAWRAVCEGAKAKISLRCAFKTDPTGGGPAAEQPAAGGISQAEDTSCAPLGVMMMCVVYITTKGHADVYGLCCSLKRHRP